IGSVIEASLIAFIGSLVDMMRATTDPKTFVTDHSGALLWMAFVAMIARPLVSAAHDVIKHQMIGTSFPALVRWQTHAYVLRQSLAFF
ncbi:hypothetical protein ACTUM1_15505, partial [Listeria monocytogenes]